MRLGCLAHRGAPPLVDDVARLLGIEGTVDKRVDANGRADGAGADVGPQLQAERTVRRLLARADAELVLDGGQDGLPTREAARGAVAHGDDVAGRRQQPEAAQAGGTED